MSQSIPVPATIPTVVFIHGAFADSSSWTGVMRSLRDGGTALLAAANPLRGLHEDAAYVASVINAIQGPVLLVGHSYGGAVIGSAAAQASNVVGLVYVAAFAPDEGETIGEVTAKFPDVALAAAVRPASVPASEADLEVLINPAAFHHAFAADLPEEETALLALMQRPIKVAAFSAPSGPTAWKSLPSWFVVATGDNAIHPDQERFYARRAGSITIEVDGSHAVAVSQPEAVADLIRNAIGTLT
jgi:pimeloyl-ACP methyl ester carboxylesterase